MYFKKIRKGVIALPVSLSVIHAGSAYGLSQDEQMRLDTLASLSIEALLDVDIDVEVATGIKQSRAQAPSVTSVITAHDIEAMSAESLEEVLASVPGMHVSLAPNGRDYLPRYVIRGIGKDQGPEALFLVNGVSINTLATGARERWRGMPVQAIARIEIIRGTGSAVYGADAFSGVVNIITKTKEDIDGTEAGVRAGSFHTQNAWLLHGGTWAGFDVAASVQYRKTDGHGETIQEDAQTVYDRVFGSDISLAPGPTNAQREGIDLNLDLARGNWRGRGLYQSLTNIGTGAGLGTALDDQGSWFQKLLLADLTYHNPSVGEHWDVSATLSYFRQSWGSESNLYVYPAGAFGGAFPNGMFGNPSYTEANTRLDLFGIYSGFADHLLRIGAGYHYGDAYDISDRKNFGTGPDGNPVDPAGPPVSVGGTPYNWLLPKGSRRAHYLSLQDTWHFAPQWELTAGVRYDHYSDFGATLNPRAALVWNTSEKLTAKLMYGRAFRAPSYNELYMANSPVEKGNPDLQPEQIQSLELAFSYRPNEGLVLDTNLFGYDIKDGIIYGPNPAYNIAGVSDATVPPLMVQNLGAQEGYGLEFEARWNVSAAASLLFNYSYVKATNKNLDIDVPKVPQQMAYVRADWRFLPAWSLDAQAKWVGERPRDLLDSRPALDGYTTVGLTLRYKDPAKHGWNLALGVRNLFDATAFEPSNGPDNDGVIVLPYDLPLAGRSWWAEVRYTFE